MDVPRLDTSRLVLRGWERRDRDPWRALCADPEVMRHIGDGTPLTAARADERVARFEGAWRDGGFSFWAVEERATGRCVGFCGVQGVPDGSGRIEIGWRLERAAWGRGIATEAALPARDWAFEELGLERLVALVRPANAASIRVIEKLGMTLDAEEIDRLGLPARIYAIARSEWERLPPGQ